MRDFEESTLWRESEFDRVRVRTGTSGFARLEGPTVLPTTLLADLRQLDTLGLPQDPLEVVAACVRHREAALLYLGYEGLVWPVTLFPAVSIYHSPRDVMHASSLGLSKLGVLGVEVPGVRPPGHWKQERVAHPDHYRALVPLLWRLALDGPRGDLLAEVAGTAAYRALKNPVEEGVQLNGALGSAVERLRRETVPLRTIAAWPGMSVQRANRLINGLYLSSALMATRAHPAARPAPVGIGDRLRGLRPKR
jgi:hypothetical protein